MDDAAKEARHQLLGMAQEVVDELKEKWSHWDPTISTHKSHFYDTMAVEDETDSSNIFEQFRYLKQMIREQHVNFDTQKFPVADVIIPDGADTFSDDTLGATLLQLGMYRAEAEQLFAVPGASDTRDRVKHELTRAIQHLSTEDDCDNWERPILLFFTSLLLKGRRYKLTPMSGFGTKYVGFSTVALHSYLLRTCPAYQQLNRDANGQSLFEDPLPNHADDQRRALLHFWVDIINRNKFLRKKLSAAPGVDQIDINNPATCKGIVLDTTIHTDGKGLRISYIDLSRRLKATRPTGLRASMSMKTH